MVASIPGPYLMAAAATPATPPPFPRNPIAASLPTDQVTILSPFGVNGTAMPTATAAPPAPTPVLDEDQHATLSTIQKITLAGLGGLAMFGALGLGGCSSPRPMPADSSRSQTLDVKADGFANDNRPAANDNGHTAVRQTSLPKAADTAQATQANPPRRVRVLGQDLGGGDDGTQNVQWANYSGTYKGQAYEIEYPKGWKVAKTFYGLAIVNPQKPDEFVTFQWRQDAGQMSPQALLQTVLQEADAAGVRCNSQKMQTPRQTPNGPLYVLESDVSYQVDGAPVRGSFITAVSSNNGYVPFWVGSVIAAQSTQADFAKDLPVLQHITNSMTQK